ncbi:MAG: 50S ribosomal protein L5 [Patescibacteria group bacterium]
MTHADTKNKETKKIADSLEKIVINAGIGRLSATPNFEEKTLPQISRDMAILSGQKPQTRRARKSIAGFKVREGQIVGLKVTLRKRKMVDFFERLIKIVLPRVRDFHGIKLDSVDMGGILSIGIREQFVFPETTPEESPVSFSLGINMVPRTKNRQKALEVLRGLGVPLEKQK